MRRLLTWLVVTIGLAALVRRLRRRHDPALVEPAPASPGDDPADELRRKLAESRAEEPPEAPDPPDETVEERRAGVHDQGRAALDDMRDSEKE